MVCSICKQAGHNKLKCPSQKNATSLPDKPSTKKAKLNPEELPAKAKKDNKENTNNNPQKAASLDASKKSTKSIKPKESGATYELQVEMGYPHDGWHSYQPPTTTTEGTFTDLAKANAACRKYVTDMGYSSDEWAENDCSWEEKMVDGCLCISASAADSEDVTARVVLVQPKGGTVSGPYTLSITSGYPRDNFHAYEKPTTEFEGTFTTLAKANSALIEYLEDLGYERNRCWRWEEEKVGGCLQIKASAEDSMDYTIQVVPKAKAQVKVKSSHKLDDSEKDWYLKTPYF